MTNAPTITLKLIRDGRVQVRRTVTVDGRLIGTIKTQYYYNGTGTGRVSGYLFEPIEGATTLQRFGISNLYGLKGVAQTMLRRVMGE